MTVLHYYHPAVSESKMSSPVYKCNGNAIGIVRTTLGSVNCIYALGSWIFAYHVVEGLAPEAEVTFDLPQAKLVYKVSELQRVILNDPKDGAVPIDLAVIPKFRTTVAIKGLHLKEADVGQPLAMIARDEKDLQLSFATGNVLTFISSTLFGHSVSTKPGHCTGALLNADDHCVGFHVAGSDTINTAIRVTPMVRDALLRAISGNQ